MNLLDMIFHPIAIGAAATALTATIGYLKNKKLLDENEKLSHHLHNYKANTATEVMRTEELVTNLRRQIVSLNADIEGLKDKLKKPETRADKCKAKEKKATLALKNILDQLNDKIDLGEVFKATNTTDAKTAKPEVKTEFKDKKKFYRKNDG